MFDFVTPESVGISSSVVKEFFEYYEDHGVNFHNVLMAKGNKIFSSVNWAPFTGDDIHRMYSVSKSFVSVAIGLLLEDGLIDLDDILADYFKDELPQKLPMFLEGQTIRNTLMMNTAITEVSLPPWFYTEEPSRGKEYFTCNNTKLPGGTFLYDSTGSYLLGALVKRVTGMDFFTFLRSRVLDEIGFSKEAICLQTPDGNAWGDSAIVCKPSDLLRFAKFVMNGGTWEGKRLMNEDYLRAATSKQCDSSPDGLNNYGSFGYGYQFWMTYENSFSMNGMGGQFAICVPHKDLIFVCTGDNQGNPFAGYCIFNLFFDRIVHGISDSPLPEDPAAFEELQKYCGSRRLSIARGEAFCSMADLVSGVEYRVLPNPMGITRMRVTFNDDGGVLSYTNSQGDKELPFGMKRNWFGKFPQYGYSDLVGGESTDNGFLYDCAVSAGWVDSHTLQLRVQIIDKYFAILIITLAFCNDGKGLGIRMIKTAEAFLDEYTGHASGLAQ